MKRREIFLRVGRRRCGGEAPPLTLTLSPPGGEREQGKAPPLTRRADRASTSPRLSRGEVAHGRDDAFTVDK